MRSLYAICLVFIFNLSCKNKVENSSSKIVQDSFVKFQPNEEGFIDYSDYPRIYFINEANVFVHEFENENSDKIPVILTIGDSVNVLGESDFSFKKDIDSLWTKVSFSNNQITTYGYIKSKYLSNSGAFSLKNSSIRYIYNRKNLNDTNGLVLYQLMYVKNKQIVKKFNLDTLYFNENMGINVMENTTKIKNVKEIVFAKKISEACGVEYIDHVFLNINDNLIKLNRNWGVSDAGVFHSNIQIHQSIKGQYFPIIDYNEPKALDSVPIYIKPYLDSSNYYLELNEEIEAQYDEKKQEEVLDKDGNNIYKTNRQIYTIFKWIDNKGLKRIKSFDALKLKDSVFNLNS